MGAKERRGKEKESCGPTSEGGLRGSARNEAWEEGSCKTGIVRKGILLRGVRQLSRGQELQCTLKVFNISTSRNAAGS
eukprot:360150-Pelagomonas_calceolata.AAC.12